MGLSGKYGQVNIPKVGLNEPVFILRAQDKLAVAAMEMYRPWSILTGPLWPLRSRKKSIVLKDGKAPKRYLINYPSFKRNKRLPDT